MIRNLVKGEVLPEKLQTGFESGKNVDADWVFIAEREGKPVGILVCAPAHVVVVLMRLVMSEEADTNDARSLLLHMVKAIKERGYNGYYTIVDPEIRAEATLGRIIEMTGGIRIPKPQFVCVGAV